MAKTIDNINKVYDRVRFNITDSKDSCVVDESNPVKLRHLVIKSAGADFHCMKTDYVKDLKCMTEKRSSRLKDSNCDGIAFVDDCVDKEHLVFAELKSCEPDSKLDEALNQIIHSFLSVMVCSLCVTDMTLITTRLILFSHAVRQGIMKKKKRNSYP